MLTAKYIIEVAAAEKDGYLYLQLKDPTKQIEIEEEMTLFVGFSRNQSSLWKMMIRQADELFEFGDELETTDHDSDIIISVERTYLTPNNPFGFTLCNEYSKGHIYAQLTIPISERALDSFLEWKTSPAGCCKFFADLLRLSLARQSQAEHYVSGGLLGGYS